MKTLTKLAIVIAVIVLAFGAYWWRRSVTAATAPSDGVACLREPAAQGVPSGDDPHTAATASDPSATHSGAPDLPAPPAPTASEPSPAQPGAAGPHMREGWSFAFEGDDDDALFYKATHLAECASQFLDRAGLGEPKFRVHIAFGPDGRRVTAVTLTEPRQAAGAAAFERCALAGFDGLEFPPGDHDRNVVLSPRSGRPHNEPEPVADVELLHKTAASGPARGPDDAPVTLVVYTDFQCGFCARVLATLDELLDDYPTQIRVVKKLFPLKPSSRRLALATMAASLQGQFWEMHDLIFAHQDAATLDDAALRGFARQLGLDVERFARDLDSAEVARRVDADIAGGQALDVHGTPTVFVGDQRVVGARPVEYFRDLIDQQLAERAPAP